MSPSLLDGRSSGTRRCQTTPRPPETRPRTRLLHTVLDRRPCVVSYATRICPRRTYPTTRQQGLFVRL